MSFDVQISKQADKDLRDIFEYIAFELLVPENAAGQLGRLEEIFPQIYCIFCRVVILSHL